MLNEAEREVGHLHRGRDSARGRGVGFGREQFLKAQANQKKKQPGFAENKIQNKKPRRFNITDEEQAEMNRQASSLVSEFGLVKLTGFKTLLSAAVEMAVNYIEQIGIEVFSTPNEVVSAAVYIIYLAKVNKDRSVIQLTHFCRLAGLASHRQAPVRFFMFYLKKNLHKIYKSEEGLDLENLEINLKKITKQ